LKLISVVIPVYNEEKNLHNLVKELDKYTTPLNDKYDWRYLFVNDGSKDKSIEVLRDLAKGSPEKIIIIDLSRNFGKEIALTAGVEASQGDAVICMDADLQHPPKIIPQLVASWEGGADVVATLRKKIHRQPLIRVMGSHLFYYLMKQFSDLDITSQTTDFRLIDRKVVDELKKISEKKRMFRALIDWLGFNKVWVEFEAPEREQGDSGFSYRNLWNLAFDSFISYSSFPLRLIGYLGVLITSSSVFTIIFMLVAKAAFNELFNFTPLAFVVVSNTFLIGVVLVAMGLMSMYINKIYAEVIDRPLYSIKEKINL